MDRIGSPELGDSSRMVISVKLHGGGPKGRVGDLSLRRAQMGPLVLVSTDLTFLSVFKKSPGGEAGCASELISAGGVAPSAAIKHSPALSWENGWLRYTKNALRLRNAIHAPLDADLPRAGPRALEGLRAAMGRQLGRQFVRSSQTARCNKCVNPNIITWATEGSRTLFP